MEEERRNLFSFLDPMCFFVALGLGFLIAYVTSPKPQLVLKFPTPSNCGKVVYRSPDGGCFRYKMETVDCEGERSAKHPPATYPGGPWSGEP